ncbi:hypothetical protein C0Q70_15637 [Pomacea canaliculata]|uniref:Uncharacterized protein n=1 Tax=Pomacea canaliculata TaxID=400727 RepID=A0A2T7NVD7_POMCA|nr:hypothetical protein C0Q70_15637 [Pomacea canaliculata]
MNGRHIKENIAPVDKALATLRIGQCDDAAVLEKANNQMPQALKGRARRTKFSPLQQNTQFCSLIADLANIGDIRTWSCDQVTLTWRRRVLTHLRGHVHSETARVLKAGLRPFERPPPPHLHARSRIHSAIAAPARLIGQRDPHCAAVKRTPPPTDPVLSVKINSGTCWRDLCGSGINAEMIHSPFPHLFYEAGY